MYYQYFGLEEAPFSIAVDPRYLYMSPRHRDALAHLLYGVGAGGGFILLTGEVGTGKTTINRCLLQQLPDNADIAIVLNPALDSPDLLATVCEELDIELGDTPPGARPGLKELTDRLHRFLLANHAAGRKTVMMIDEAQHLSFDVLEQIRLLTNLETNREKLLHIILIGQPELAEKLSRPELRQLNQRITARFELAPLSAAETGAYIRHRLHVAGMPAGQELFPPRLVRAIHRETRGVPRLINLLCDRMLLGAYGQNRIRLDGGLLRRAAQEVTGRGAGAQRFSRWGVPVIGLGALILVGAALWLLLRPAPTTPEALLDPTAQSQPLRPGAVSARANPDAAGAGAPAADPVRGETLPAGGVATQTASAASAAQTARSSAAGAVPAVAELSAGVDAPYTGQAPRQSQGVPRAETTARAQNVAQTGSAPGLSMAPVAAAGWELSPSEGVRLMESLHGVSGRPPGRDLCSGTLPDTLRCERGRAASWDELLEVGRPALLTLLDARRFESSVVFLGIDGDEALLAAPDGLHRGPLAALAGRWTGEVQLLWRLPSGLGRVLRRGDRGADVREVARLFAQLDGQERALGGDVYDSRLETRVRLFQRRMGLADDGVLGEQTLRVLLLQSGEALTLEGARSALESLALRVDGL